MSTRLDLVLQKHPDQEAGIRVLAGRDPSGNQKYLAWGGAMLASGQALVNEVANVLDLFHRFAGQRRVLHPDINTYRPQDFARLRDLLSKMKKAQDAKRKKREKLYRIQGGVEADVVYDSDDLIVRHIKNKNASVHYGHATKWCISMSREGYFEDYETHNATFFFFERKKALGDEHDKVCLVMFRVDIRGEETTAFNALDRRMDMFALAKIHGPRVFEIFRLVHEASARYPGSVLFQAFQGTATREQLEAVFVRLVKGEFGYETDNLLEAICCNDAAPAAMLEEILKRGVAMSAAARKKGHGRRSRRQRNHHDAELTRKIMAALVIHPQTPGELRERLVKDLRRRHVKIVEIRRVVGDGGVGVEYRNAWRWFKRHTRFRRRFRPRHMAIGALRSRLRGLEQRIAQTKKWIKKRLEADKKTAKRKAR